MITSVFSVLLISATKRSLEKTFASYTFFFAHLFICFRGTMQKAAPHVWAMRPSPDVFLNYSCETYALNYTRKQESKYYYYYYDNARCLQPVALIQRLFSLVHWWQEEWPDFCRRRLHILLVNFWVHSRRWSDATSTIRPWKEYFHAGVRLQKASRPTCSSLRFLLISSMCCETWSALFFVLQEGATTSEHTNNDVLSVLHLLMPF